MSLFKKLGKSIKGVTGQATGWVTGGALNTNGGGWAQGGDFKTGFSGAGKDGNGGISEIAGITNIDDLMYGKKTKTNADDIAGAVKRNQARGIDELNSALDTPADKIIGNQVALEKRGILTAAQDARRNAQRAIAQRGLAGSSLGLAQNRTIDQNATESAAALDARAPGMVRNQALQDAQMRISQGGLGGSNPIQWNTETNRGGGLLDFAGKIAPIAGMVAGLPSFGSMFGGGRVDAAGGRTAMSRDYLNGNTGGF